MDQTHEGIPSLRESVSLLLVAIEQEPSSSSQPYTEDSSRCFSACDRTHDIVASPLMICTPSSTFIQPTSNARNKIGNFLKVDTVLNRVIIGAAVGPAYASGACLQNICLANLFQSHTVV